LLKRGKTSESFAYLPVHFTIASNFANSSSNSLNTADGFMNWIPLSKTSKDNG
jgi:hypothetical protein